MSNFLDTAHGNSKGKGGKAQELEGKAECENNSLGPREFFWDNVVLFVVSSILALAAVDIVTEFVRGGEVACFPPNASSGEAEANFINRFCTSNVPFGAYLSPFMVVHGLLIGIPHYLWLNHFGGSFGFFFQLATTLKRVKESNTGQYTPENLLAVGQLQASFSTYRRRHIFDLYIVKLGFQLAWVIGGVIFVTIFFTGRFGPSFNCPTDFDGATDEWPIDTDVTCVFDTLNLLQVLWIAEILLLLLAAFGLTWALIWCFSIHPTELGSSEIADFSFHYGLSSEYYIPKLPIAHCCGAGLRFLFRFSRSLQRISFGGPRIHTDLDFMVMKLFRTDGGLGHVFKEVQVSNHLKRLCDDDRRRLNIHARKHRNITAQDSANQQHSGQMKNRQTEIDDLMWTFTKISKRVGVYRDFQTLAPDHPVVLPGTMRGTVLGFSARAPGNGSAIEVSFGTPSFATSLARVFKWVTALNFSSDYNGTAKALSTEFYYTHTLSLTCPEDIFSTESQARAEFLEGIKAIWVRPGSASFLHTGFIVIGPIPEEKSFHLTTVDLLLETIAGCLCKDAVLLVLRPLQISNKDVTNRFCSYQPPQPSFEPLEQTYDVVNQAQEWTARKSSSQQRSHRVMHSPGREQSLFRLHVLSADISCIMEFTTYRYTDTPHRNLPEMYRPTPPPLAVPTMLHASSEISLVSREPEPLSSIEESFKESEGQVPVPVREKNANLENESSRNSMDLSMSLEKNI